MAVADSHRSSRFLGSTHPDALPLRGARIPRVSVESPVLGTAVFLYGGLVFLKGAWRELRARLPGMMTLISIAISVAFIFSWVVQLGLIEADPIWWELGHLGDHHAAGPLGRDALDRTSEGAA